MRFLDERPLEPRLTCDAAVNDVWADFTPPFELVVGQKTSFWIFDSSGAFAKAKAAGDPIQFRHAELLRALGQAKPDALNIFLSHHPFSAVVADASGQPKQAGTAGLQAALKQAFGPRLLPVEFQLAMHGHVHLFEAQIAEPGQTSAVILGNSGSMQETQPPKQIEGAWVMSNGAPMRQFISQPGYGFAFLTRSKDRPDSQWTLTEHDATGQPLARCLLSTQSMDCEPLSTEKITKYKQSNP
jgi:hypothetical protein